MLSRKLGGSTHLLLPGVVSSRLSAFASAAGESLRLHTLWYPHHPPGPGSWSSAPAIQQGNLGPHGPTPNMSQER